jgi:hypothetical protein
MSDYTVTLTISENAYKRARQIAEASAQPVEQILASQLDESFSDLSALPADEQAEFAALNHLSDDTLWTIAAEKMPPVQQERVSLLLALNKRSVLTEAEQTELDQLLERGDRLMLRKAEAAAILMRRGHKFTREDFATPHE